MLLVVAVIIGLIPIDRNKGLNIRPPPIPVNPAKAPAKSPYKGN
jgi:hypothetical protein